MTHATRLLLLSLPLLFVAATPARGKLQYVPALADDAPPWDDDVVRLAPFTGLYRVDLFHVSPLVLDAGGARSPLHDYADHRLRLSPAIAWRSIMARVTVDFLDGQLGGDHENFAPGYQRLERRAEDTGREIGDLLLREAWFRWQSPIGVLKIGQMASEYGLGILANGGRDDPDRFGVSRFGDIVDRLVFATTPFLPLTGKGGWGEYVTVIAAGDLVYRDEQASVVDGDLAGGATVGVAYRDPHWTDGFFFTYRKQKDADGDDLEAFAFDVNGRNRLDFGGAFPTTFELAYEFAALIGSTNRFVNFGAEHGVDIQSYGAVARLTYELTPIDFDFSFELGYASGDGNPYDGTSRSFYFDPDYHVGLIFFDEFLPLVSARAVEQLTDPAHSALPPKGIDASMSQGRATNTLYVMPMVRYRPPLGVPGNELQLMLGALVLTSPQHFAQSFYSFENGGVATNHLQRTTNSRYLGTELLVGAHFRMLPAPEHIGLSLRFEESTFFPGKALAYPCGLSSEVAWKLLISTAVEWR